MYGHTLNSIFERKFKKWYFQCTKVEYTDGWKKIQLNQIGLLFTRKNLVYNEVVVYPHSGLCALCFYILLLSQSVIAHRECTYVKIHNIYEKWCVHIISNKLNLLVLIKLINLISAKGFYKLKVNRIVILYFCFLALVMFYEWNGVHQSISLYRHFCVIKIWVLNALYAYNVHVVKSHASGFRDWNRFYLRSKKIYSAPRPIY